MKYAYIAAVVALVVALAEFFAGVTCASAAHFFAPFVIVGVGIFAEIVATVRAFRKGDATETHDMIYNENGIEFIGDIFPSAVEI